MDWNCPKKLASLTSINVRLFGIFLKTLMKISWRGMKQLQFSFSQGKWEKLAIKGQGGTLLLTTSTSIRLLTNSRSSLFSWAKQVLTQFSSIFQVSKQVCIAIVFILYFCGSSTKETPSFRGWMLSLICAMILTFLALVPPEEKN